MIWVFVNKWIRLFILRYDDIPFDIIEFFIKCTVCTFVCSLLLDILYNVLLL